VWPISYAVQMTTVLVVTLAMLFLPKLLAWLLLIADTKLRKSFGGLMRAGLSLILESAFSMLLAPVLMLFQTKFVLAILFRRNVGWPPQQRGDHQTGFTEAILAHGGQTLLGIVVGAATYWYIPTFFWWFTPVLLGLVLAIPLSMFSSSMTLGRQARKWGLFLTPQETSLPQVLQFLRDNLRKDAEMPALPVAGAGRFSQALTEPFVNALHIALLPAHLHAPSRRRRHFLESLIYQLLEDGPHSLSAAEKRELLADQDTLRRLHILAWGHPHIGALSIQE